ncbi:hypothetical protein ECH_0949 [Ehrlichia chaffeensis str. Arkansas]|uniref:Uncharacterized protein n=1 Tax=Ehrlichia chaffeensis (strain ATCC CRL-10679 / Arkansas) TaxID=205920 RepID=Q2GFP6_EHRCR|nr:hypothetical protein ECH_0949 [Ehrlichia chaffeensis str. Arkansas]
MISRSVYYHLKVKHVTVYINIEEGLSGVTHI